MKKKSKPKIYKYNDVIVFLKDVFVYFKNKENKSMRNFAHEMKIASGLLPMVLGRKRTLTEKMLKKIMIKFDYTKADIEFAKNLRLVGYSEDYSERKHAIYKINKNKKYRELNQNEFEIYKYLSKWYYVGIKEMTELSDFREDTKWIQDRLTYKVGLKEIEQALLFLKKSGILIYENEKLVAAKKNMNCEEGIFKLTLGGFHKQVLELAGNAIDLVPREKRRILGHTLMIDKTNIEKMNDILNEAFEKIKSLNSLENSDEEVYHVEFVSIPLTKKVESV